MQAVEEMEGKVWAKPANGVIYAKKLGDSKLGGLRIVLPAINNMASAEISVQVQLRNGVEGARPLTIQSTRAGLMNYAKAPVMTFGAIKGPSADGQLATNDLDLSGYF